MWEYDFIDIQVIAGSNRGMCFSIEANTFRIIGRNEQSLSLIERITYERQIILNADQQEFAESALKNLKLSNPNLLTRGPDICFDDPSISRAHLLVIFARPRLEVLDLLTNNGTLLNGDKIESAFLSLKDSIQIGVSRIAVLPG